MLEPYILVGGPDLMVLQHRVNLYAQDQDYQPVGPPFRGQDQWFQAMYRAPEQDEPQINTLEEAAESSDHDALAEFAERVEPPDPNWEDECRRLREQLSEYGRELVEANEWAWRVEQERNEAIERAEGARRSRDELVGRLKQMELDRNKYREERDKAANERDGESKLTDDEQYRLFCHCIAESRRLEREYPSGGARVFTPFRITDPQLNQVLSGGPLELTPAQVKQWLTERAWPQASVSHPEYRAHQDAENDRLTRAYDYCSDQHDIGRKGT